MFLLPQEFFKRYHANPLGMDDEVRQFCHLPENRYYTVSVWPVEGEVRISNQVRTVKSKKISKSDQPENSESKKKVQDYLKKP